MENNDSQSPWPSYVRVRNCPACQSPVKNLSISAVMTPIETVTMPWLRMINKQAGVSFRTASQAHLHEPQFLCFIHVCQCSFVSTWDLNTEELEFFLNAREAPTRILWMQSPKNLAAIRDRLPETQRETWDSLVAPHIQAENQK